MNMKIERVDDIPLLLSLFDQSNLSALINECFSTHGLWEGADFGTLGTVFLSYVLSCCDRRLSHVEIVY